MASQLLLVVGPRLLYLGLGVKSALEYATEFGIPFKVHTYYLLFSWYSFFFLKAKLKDLCVFGNPRQDSLDGNKGVFKRHGRNRQKDTETTRQTE